MDVVIYGEPTAKPTKFRTRIAGRRRKSKPKSKDSCFGSWKQAYEHARTLVDQMDAGVPAAESADWRETHEVAAEHRLAIRELKPTGMSLMDAISLIVQLLALLPVAKLRVFLSIYAPRLAEATPTLVEVVVDQHVQKLLKRWGVNDKRTPFQRRKLRQIRHFGAHFKGRIIGQLSLVELTAYMEAHYPSPDQWNTALYALRETFTEARDRAKALPKGLPTEMDLIEWQPHGPRKKDIFSVRAFARIMAAVPDKQCLLALKLAGQLHVRQEEVHRLQAEWFLRDANRLPYRLDIPASASKTKIGRPIAIEPGHAAVLRELLPLSGPLFVQANPFNRIRSLARRLGIPWPGNGFRHSCVSYRVCAGESEQAVAEKCGHTVPIMKRHYLVHAPFDKAKLYCSMLGSIQHARSLPWFRKLPRQSHKEKATP